MKKLLYILFSLFVLRAFARSRTATPPANGGQSPFGQSLLIGGGGSSGGSSGGGGSSNPNPVTYTVTGGVHQFDSSGFRVKIDVNKGGVITWLGNDTVNVVDDRDAGRYNGVSVYLPPDNYTQAGGVVTNPEYTAASWNIVQAGSDGDTHPTVNNIVWNAQTNTLSFTLVPLQWKFSNRIESTDSLLTVSYVIDPVRKAVRASYNIAVNRPGNFGPSGHIDETGFFYAKRAYDQLTTYDGPAPFTNAPTTVPPYDDPNTQPGGGLANMGAIFDPKERWLALSNGQNSFGILYRTPADVNAWVQKVDAFGGYVLVQKNANLPAVTVFSRTVQRDYIFDTPANVRAYAYLFNNGTI